MISITCSLILIFGCGKNESGPISPKGFLQNNRPETKTEEAESMTLDKVNYKLTYKDLTINYNVEQSEATLVLKAESKAIPSFKEVLIDYPVVKFIRTPNSSWHEPANVPCPVTISQYLNHTFTEISGERTQIEDFEFFFNGEEIQPEILEENPLTISLDFKTIQGKRELLIKNKTAQKERKYHYNRRECDWVLKQNPDYSIDPSFKENNSMTDFPSHKVFTIETKVTRNR